MVIGSSRAFGSPLRYIQGPYELDNLESYSSVHGENVLFLIDANLFESLNVQIKSIYENTNSNFKAIKFGGECCQTEIDNVSSIAKEYKTDILIGVGGGKTLDTAKLCSDSLSIPFIIVPTSASTDAPVSEIAVLYSDEGEYICSKKLKHNAVLVLVDSNLIAHSPKRLFVAGIADALATFFEAKAAMASDSPNYVGKGFRRCKAAMAIARACYDIVLEDSHKALLALEKNIVTEAFENIIEANILLSGLGFNNTGLAAAHAIHSGLTVIPETHKYLHGEKVAFGIVCQMVLENTNSEEVDKIMKFMVSLDIPVTLAQIGVEESDKNVRAIAQKTAQGSKLIYNEPFYIDEDILYAAIYGANELGNKYLEGFNYESR